jgi:hypothetical protein
LAKAGAVERLVPLSFPDAYAALALFHREPDMLGLKECHKPEGMRVFFFRLRF